MLILSIHEFKPIFLANLCFYKTLIKLIKPKRDICNNTLLSKQLFLKIFIIFKVNTKYMIF